MPDYLWTARLEAAARARGLSLASPQTLAGDGSDRRFYRLLGSPTAVLLFHPFPPGDEVNENDSYYLVGRHLRGKGVPVPEIYTYCREEFWMLIEDLGDISLESVIRRQPDDSQVRHWYRQALKILLDLFEIVSQVDILLEVAGGLLELRQASAQRAGYFGEFFGPEDHQGQRQYQ